MLINNLIGDPYQEKLREWPDEVSATHVRITCKVLSPSELSSGR
jgi:hypothetical protein